MEAQLKAARTAAATLEAQAAAAKAGFSEVAERVFQFPLNHYEIEAKQLASAARALGESLAMVDAQAETVARASALVGELSRARPADKPAVLARMDELGRSAEGQAAQVDRERLGLAGTPGEEAVRTARETLSRSRAELDARRAQLEQEGEALAAKMAGNRQPAELSPDRVQRAREQISSDSATAVAAQSAQLTQAASAMLA
jgi:hypothetical protein